MNAAGVLIVLAFPVEPPLSDLDRFPSYEVAVAEVARADDHLAWLVAAASLDRVNMEWWKARLKEAQAAREPWVYLRSARFPPPCDIDRHRLAAIKALVSPTAYASGILPPSVPDSHAGFR